MIAITFLCCSVLEPLLTRNITASILPACAAYIRAVDPSWRAKETDVREIVEIDRSVRHWQGTSDYMSAFPVLHQCKSYLRVREHWCFYIDYLVWHKVATSDEWWINEARYAGGYRCRTEIGIRWSNRDCLRYHSVPAAAIISRTQVTPVIIRRWSREVCEEGAG